MTDDRDERPAYKIDCPMCDEVISSRAKKCRHCGETLDPALRRAEEAMRASERRSGDVYVNSHNSGRDDVTYNKSKVTAGLLAILIGGIGAHKFYLDRPGQGIIYLLFCWTFIPAIVSFLEGIVYLVSSDDAFARKYG